MLIAFPYWFILYLDKDMLYIYYIFLSTKSQNTIQVTLPESPEMHMLHTS